MKFDVYEKMYSFKVTEGVLRLIELIKCIESLCDKCYSGLKMRRLHLLELEKHTSLDKAMNFSWKKNENRKTSLYNTLDK